jgi:hypothetical protein
VWIDGGDDDGKYLFINSTSPVEIWFEGGQPWVSKEYLFMPNCYGRLAVVSDVDDGGFALNVDKELRGSAVL